MPDFERLLDELFIETSNSLEEKARREGFVQGKSYVRKQMLLVFLLVVIAFIFSFSFFV